MSVSALGCRLTQVVANRTFNVLPIVEGVYDMGNLAAITRSSDGAAALDALSVDLSQLGVEECQEACTPADG